MRTKVNGYSGRRKALHWLCALLVAGAYGVIWAREGFDGTAERAAWLHAHRVIGLLVLATAAARIAALIFDGAPPPVAGARPWERPAAAAAHILLYLGLFAQPLLGWAAVSAKGRVFDIYGLITLPVLLGKDPDWADRFGAAHEVVGAVMGGLIALHVVAALFHRFILRDEIFARMGLFLSSRATLKS